MYINLHTQHAHFIPFNIFEENLATGNEVVSKNLFCIF
jgi:hypothetical protein